jgi:hypothetical protein
MLNQVRIKVEHVVDGKIITTNVVVEQAVNKVGNIAELGFNHQQQINILKGCQDGLLKIQEEFLEEEIECCPNCGSKLKYAGKIASHFHSVFTDHKVAIKRKKCCNGKCGWTSVPSVSSLFKTNSHPDLSKLQTETACNHAYREAERLMNAQSYYPRKVNNHEHIYRTVEIVGNYISDHQITDIPADIAPTEELICQVDGAHLKSKEEDSRSFEALTAVVYSPKNVVYPTQKEANTEEYPRGEIVSKHCAASALEDGHVTIKKQTLIAAQKQGLTAETNVVALCDGAANCWDVIKVFEGQCSSITRILDWFHITKRFKNISLPKYLEKKLEHIKWCIWHGQIEKGLSRFDEVIDKTRNNKMQDRLIKLKNYLENNKPYLINYEDRHNQGKIISSSVAESNVESLINKRCGGKQHMRWSREGVHPLLQVRASCASNDWYYFGSQYVLNAMTQQVA